MNVNVLMLLTPKASVTYVFSKDTIEDAAKTVRLSGYTSVPVLEDDGRYAGSLSEGDLLWDMMDNSGDDLKRPVSEIVNREKNAAVHVDVTMDVLTGRVLNQNYVPVIDDRGFFIGIVTRRDVMGHLLKER